MFETHAEALCSEYAKKNSSGVDGLLENVEEYHAKAREHFIAAYGNFKKINHIKGQSMALKHESNLIKNDGDLKAKTLRKANVLNRKYEQYVNSFGTETSCHIPRE